MVYLVSLEFQFGLMGEIQNTPIIYDFRGLDQRKTRLYGLFLFNRR